MIEQDPLCYINSASSELTINYSDDIIPSPDLVSFSLVATSIDNRRVYRQTMTVNNLQRQGYSKDQTQNF